MKREIPKTPIVGDFISNSCGMSNKLYGIVLKVEERKRRDPIIWVRYYAREEYTRLKPYYHPYNKGVSKIGWRSKHSHKFEKANLTKKDRLKWRRETDKEIYNLKRKGENERKWKEKTIKNYNSIAL